ncbi:VWA domain-containing protein [Rhodococcus fascians]|uniref:vWA domain-containing protein n=1 Tax=Rhodococcoides fascians TaxID=1828 RepID=UPI0019603641|nr:VWA domain-containing protein [Rhodococcus fascians]MBM7244085.1 VWA domain-containing protein [Rhodococcus fascians]MBY3810558.1 VWA domain-containing protein [Rhodococcus fascians]MBY3841819.1 VWA domain-containing protein [Rhodococcus fascians]MBY3844270.1 VWA domain-containing protein [Rhodococcus fascians]MBY3850216.1 VWA domain-containing protein [Rhodococcus fascians]
MRRSRYGRYHEGPDPLAPPVDLREALDAIGEDVLEGASPRRALQEMLRRGTKNMRGLDDLAAQAAKRRRDLLKQNNLDGTLQEVRELLDKAVLEERKALARALDDDARFQEMQIGDLSPSTAQAVQELSDYDWRSSEGRENYEKIKDLLGREMLDQRFAGMKQALEGATEQDRQAISEMLKDLNELLDAHNKGENTDEQFDEFMNKHGQHFPENPKNVDELLDSLAERAAAAQRLRNSLTPEQRAELDALAQQAFGDSNLLDQLDQLDQNLQQARPGEDWDGSQNFRGENGMGLGDGTGALQDIADLENLGNQLSQQYNGAALDDIDADALLKQLGPEAAADARMLSELEKALQQQGFMDKGADGQWRLSPKAMRQLGQSALKDVAGTISRRSGERDTRKAGAMGEPTGASRTWEFGDTEPWDVTRTVNNAVLRTAAQGSGFPVQLQVTDVEISETETRTQAAVALLVDTSFSMVMDGRWVPMKRTALALNHLVSTRFRGDDLQLIGFGRHAQTLTASELAGLDGAYDQGTNLHHALMLAVRHLRRHPIAQPVVLIVTDGEPTAHLEPDGHAYFDYPPSSKTLGLTVRELDTVAKLGAQVTIFRLGDDPGLARVVDKMAERVGGRVIAPDLDGLGAAVVSDYLKRRRS